MLPGGARPTYGSRRQKKNYAYMCTVPTCGWSGVRAARLAACPACTGAVSRGVDPVTGR